MITIPLQAINNQSLAFQTDTARYNLTIRDSSGIVSVDVDRDGVRIVSGVRAMPSGAIIPYTYLEDGNFSILTDQGEYPISSEFGVSQSLVYLTPSDLEVLRNGG